MGSYEYLHIAYFVKITVLTFTFHKHLPTKKIVGLGGFARSGW